MFGAAIALISAGILSTAASPSIPKICVTVVVDADLLRQQYRSDFDASAQFAGHLRVIHSQNPGGDLKPIKFAARRAVDPPCDSHTTDTLSVRYSTFGDRRPFIVRYVFRSAGRIRRTEQIIDLAKRPGLGNGILTSRDAPTANLISMEMPSHAQHALTFFGLWKGK